MKYPIIVFVVFFLVGCAPLATNSVNPYRAIYLVQENGQLSAKDLQAHPEIMVTNSFDQFKKLAKTKTALWIDTNAVGLVDRDWLHTEPQKIYPIALVGYGDASCSFIVTMEYFLIIGPGGYECNPPPPGFSVSMLRYDNSQGISAFMKGYKQTPTAQDVLNITNALLDGEIK